MKTLITQSLEMLDTVIKESVRNSERLVELKERFIKTNSREQYRFDQLKNVNVKKEKIS